MTSAADGDSVFFSNFGPNAVQIAASKPRSSAHWGKLGMFRGAVSLGCHEPINESASSLLIFSRSHSASLAAWRSVDSMRAHKTRIGLALRSITRVIRPPDDCRVNSTGAKGPSLNHSRRIGSARGSQIRDPHPKHAIFKMGFRTALMFRRKVSASAPEISDVVPCWLNFASL